MEYVSDTTKRLIDERDKATREGNEWLANSKKRAIKKQVRKDKVDWIDALINAELNCKDNWDGIKILKNN